MEDDTIIDPDELPKLKALKRAMDDYTISGDRAREISRKRREETEKETGILREISDLTASISSKKSKIEEIEKNIKMQLGAQVSIERQIVQSQVNLENSVYRSDVLSDAIKEQNIILAQKEKQYQQEIAMGKVTDQINNARIRELSAIKDIIKKKREEIVSEERLQIILKKKIPLLEKESRLKGIRIRGLRDELELTKKTLRLDEAKLGFLKASQLIERRIFGESEDYFKIKRFAQDMAKGGIHAMLAVLNASLERWKELDKAALSFRDSTGLLVSQTRELDNAAREVNVQLAHIGVGIKEAYDAAASLTNQMKVVGLVTKGSISSVAELRANIGIATEDSAKFYGMFESISKSAGTTSIKLIGAASVLSDMAGVAPAMIMKDVANASEDTLKFLAKSPIQLIRTAVEARRLGTTLDSLSKSARGMLNYQDSITSELEASALLGRALNFQEARNLAYQGKIAESREAAMRQIKRAGDFSRMNVYQQEALARASGMTVEEITKQLNQEKILAALQKEKPEMYKKYMEYQKKIKDDEKSAQKDLVKQGEEFVKQQMRQSEMNKLTNSLKSIWTNITDSLVPVANAIMPAIITGTRTVATGFRAVGSVIKGFLSPLDAVFSQFRSGNSAALDLEKTFAKIHTFIEGKIVPAAETFGMIFGNIYAGVTKISIGIALIRRNAGLLVDSYMPFVSMMEKAGTFISNWMTGIGKAISAGKYLSGAFGKVFSPIAKIFGFLIEIGAMIPKIGGPVLKLVGTFAKVLGPVGVIINAIQVIMDLSGQLLSIWNSKDMSPGEKIIRSLISVPKALYNAIIKPFLKIIAYVTDKVVPGLGTSILNGLESIGESIVDFIVSPIKTASKMIDGILDFGGSILKGIKSIGSSLLDVLMKPFESAYNLISKMFSSGGDVSIKIIEGIKSVGVGILAALTIPFQMLKDLVSKMFSNGGELVGKIIEGIKLAGTAILSILISPYKAMAEFVSDLFSKQGTIGKGILDGVKTIGSSILSAYKTIFLSAANIITAPFKLIFSAFSEIGSLVKSMLDGISGEKIIDSIKKIATNSIEIFKSVFSSLTDIIVLPFKTAGQVAKGIFDTIIQSLKAGDQIVDKISGIIKNVSKIVLDGMKTAFSTLTSIIREPFSSLVSFVPEIFDTIGTNILKAIKSIAKGISSSFKSAFSFAIDTASSAFKNIFEIGSVLFSTGGKLASKMMEDVTKIGKFILTTFKTAATAILDIFSLPFKFILESVQKIAKFGSDLIKDITAKVSGDVQTKVSSQSTSVVEIRGINELKDTMDKLNTTISRLGEANIAPVINVKTESEETVEKLNELIELLRSGAIAVNMDGLRVSQGMARRS